MRAEMIARCFCTTTEHCLGSLAWIYIFLVFRVHFGFGNLPTAVSEHSAERRESQKIFQPKAGVRVETFQQRAVHQHLPNLEYEIRKSWPRPSGNFGLLRVDCFLLIVAPVMRCHKKGVGGTKALAHCGDAVWCSLSLTVLCKIEL